MFKKTLYNVFQLIVIQIFVFNTFAQSYKPEKILNQKFYEDKIAELQLENSKNKHIPDQMELSCLVALTFYPELDSIPITFLFKDIKTTMQARPFFKDLYKKKDKRRYYIAVDIPILNDSGVFFHLPFNAKVGVIGHELAHIVDYSHKSSFGILGLGLRYLSKKGKRKIENRIDQITVDHLLGWQLYDFNLYVFKSKNVPEKYLRYKKLYYYNDEEILQIMQNSGKY